MNSNKTYTKSHKGLRDAIEQNRSGSQHKTRVGESEGDSMFSPD